MYRSISLKKWQKYFTSNQTSAADVYLDVFLYLGNQGPQPKENCGPKFLFLKKLVGKGAYVRNKISHVTCNGVMHKHMHKPIDVIIDQCRSMHKPSIC